ncbi:MAG: SpoIVB peptidase [Clostridia bacterium]|nr:SpoIVB peptidase [Clostridia bacterium]
MTRKKVFFWKSGFKLAAALSFLFALMLVLSPTSEENISAAANAEINAERPEEAATAVSIGERLIAAGQTTGIKLFSEGTMVVGFAGVEPDGASPAKKAGIELGDIIIGLNGSDISSNEDLVSEMAGISEPEISLRVKRGEEEKEMKIEAVYDEAAKCYKMGAWVRDSIAGIGTITFIDPKTGAFGALGHGICDADTGVLMPIESGRVMHSSVAAVKKSLDGEPGELVGKFELESDSGVLYANTERGIFGRLDDPSEYESGRLYPAAKRSEIQEGKASIICNIEGTEKAQYDIEIIKIYNSAADDPKDMMIRITDKELLGLTGGIVQGMSGSPILQNGKLVGAVTHVLVNDTKRGYAISIEKMIEQAESLSA